MILRSLIQKGQHESHQFLLRRADPHERFPCLVIEATSHAAGARRRCSSVRYRSRHPEVGGWVRKQGRRCATAFCSGYVPR